MKNFVAECTCDGVTVTNALARYIHREGIRPEFWERMEEPSEETCDVAFDIFDRYGTVQAKYHGVSQYWIRFCMLNRGREYEVP